MPGYAPPPDAEFPREGSGWEGVEEEQEFPDFDGPDDGLRQTIPIMPRFLAVVCFVLNVLGPGLGLNVIYRASVQSKSYIVMRHRYGIATHSIGFSVGYRLYTIQYGPCDKAGATLF